MPPPPTTTEAALLWAVCAFPGDDAPRAAYADYLDETGEGLRAEFIRVQLALANPEMRVCACIKSRWPGMNYECAPCARVAALRRRERELLDDDNRTAWFAVPGLGVQLQGDAGRLFWWVQPEGPRIEATVRRGFVESVTLPCALWCGGPCRRCENGFIRIGFGGRHGYGPPIACPACRGIGRVGGLGPALVRAAPPGERYRSHYATCPFALSLVPVRRGLSRREARQPPADRIGNQADF